MIGERLKIIRKKGNLSQKALAEILTTSSGYISEIEQGKTVPGGNFLSSLNRALQVSIDWLLTGKGEIYLKGTITDEVHPEISEFLSMTRKILESNTHYALSLQANINSFHRGMNAEGKIDDLERRVSQIERDQKKEVRFREGDPESMREEILKRRAG